MTQMSRLLWELMALTGLDQDEMEIVLAFHRAGGDVAAARQSLGLPAEDGWPCLTMFW
jgi:hypothetical protein